MKKELKEQARVLRKKGLSIPQITKDLEVSKSSVSLWVRDIPQPEKFTKKYLQKKKEERLFKLAELRSKNKKPPKKRLMYGDRIAIRAPEDYKGKKYKSLYVYEHRYLLEQKLGRLLEDGEVAHHINGDPFDNRQENLELKTKETHGEHHAKKKTIVKLTCSFCGRIFDRELRNYNTKKKQGQTRFYCCRSHQVRDQKR